MSCGPSAGTQKRNMLYVLSYSSIPNAYPSLTLDHQTVLAQHTVHLILVSCGPGGEYSSGVSSPTVGHAYTNFPNFSIIVLSRHRHFASITRCAACARAMSTGTANPRLRDILSSARLNNVSVYIPPTQSPARLHVKRSHDPFLDLDARATRRPCLGLSPENRSALSP